MLKSAPKKGSPSPTSPKSLDWYWTLNESAGVWAVRFGEPVLLRWDEEKGVRLLLVLLLLLASGEATVYVDVIAAEQARQQRLEVGKGRVCLMYMEL